MVFNSIEFAIFLPVVFLLYWFVFNRNLKLQNLFIVIVSYIFYGWWDWRFLFLIAFTSFCSWGSGLLIKQFRDDDRRSKTISAANIILNLAILGVFKYYDFFATSFADLFLGGKTDGLLLNIILPVGISFYTFKAMSYPIDVHRGRVEPEKDWVNILAYISFFPQLLCGPIARSNDFLPQLKIEKEFSYSQASAGMKQIMWGLFKKSMIADNCAYYVNIVYGDIASQSASTLVLCAFLYSIQIYCDFSGYSDISIGAGNLLGYETKSNFKFPYFSRSIREFWRRWHISLTSWFTDYVYIPLGGSRVPKIRVMLNTLIVFLLSGLWHGASWTFVLWGLFHAFFFFPSILSGRKMKLDSPPRIMDFGRIALTFIVVTFGWILFRADNKSQAFFYVTRMVSIDGLFSIPWLHTRAFYIPLFISIFFLFVVEWYVSRGREYVFRNQLADKITKWIICIVITLSVIFCGSPSSSYIYFQF